jgi:hypothetical protein
MKPEEINIAIAEIVGWRRYRSPLAGPRFIPPWNKTSMDLVGLHDTEKLPDYYNSLDAIREAFKSMNQWSCIEFMNNLIRVHCERSGKHYNGYKSAALLYSDAEDWAKAFLETYERTSTGDIRIKKQPEQQS